MARNPRNKKRVQEADEDSYSSDESGDASSEDDFEEPPTKRPKARNKKANKKSRGERQSQDSEDAVTDAEVQYTNPKPIDYRCEDGRFPVSGSCLTISNPDLLPSSETGVNLGIRSWRKHSSE
jgi:hypothetical protein